MPTKDVRHFWFLGWVLPAGPDEMGASDDALRYAGWFAVGSAAGWVMEYVWTGEPHYSRIWNRKKLPLLPIYGLGAAALVAWFERIDATQRPVLAYGGAAAVASAVEVAAGYVGEGMYDEKLWDYSKNDDGSPNPYAVGPYWDAQHGLIWLLLGVAVDKLNRGLPANLTKVPNRS